MKKTIERQKTWAEISPKIRKDILSNFPIDTLLADTRMDVFYGRRDLAQHDYNARERRELEKELIRDEAIVEGIIALMNLIGLKVPREKNP